MGAHCSIHNDTQDETVMVYVGVNTKVLQPILWSITGAATLLSGGVALGSVPGILSVSVATGAEAAAVISISVSTLTAAAGGFVSATNFVLEQLQTQLVNDLAKGGYHKLLPGQTYTTQKLTAGLNLRAWVVRIQKTEQAIIMKRCDASVWSGAKPGSRTLYRVLDKSVFSHWTNHETIPIRYEHCPQEIGDSKGDSEADEEDGQYAVLDSGMVNCQCTLVEERAVRTEMIIDEDGAWDFVDTDLQNEWVQVDTRTAGAIRNSDKQ